MSRSVGTFKDTYNRLTRSSLSLLDDLYDESVVFEDPLHRIQGLPALRAYFERLYADIHSCRFTFEAEVVQDDQAVLTWTMHLQHTRFHPGERLHLPGATHIRFADKVVYHRDYFDVGALLYERVPLLGPLVRAIKSRL